MIPIPRIPLFLTALLLKSPGCGLRVAQQVTPSPPLLPEDKTLLLPQGHTGLSAPSAAAMQSAATGTWRSERLIHGTCRTELSRAPAGRTVTTGGCGRPVPTSPMGAVFKVMNGSLPPPEDASQSPLSQLQGVKVQGGSQPTVTTAACGAPSVPSAACRGGSTPFGQGPGLLAASLVPA